MDAALGHLPNIVKVDDLLCYGDQFDKHVKDMRTLLETCRENKITLNKAKFQFARYKAKFAGYIVSRDGVEADPDKVDAIAKFPRPENVTQMRSFMGLVQQLADFSAEISMAAGPLRPLLRSNTPYIWTEDHTLAYAEVKKALTAPPVLSIFDPTAETYLHTDASP